MGCPYQFLDPLPLHKLLPLMPRFRDTLATLTANIHSASPPVNLTEPGTGPSLMDSQNPVVKIMIKGRDLQTTTISSLVPTHKHKEEERERVTSSQAREILTSSQRRVGRSSVPILEGWWNHPTQRSREGRSDFFSREGRSFRRANVGGVLKPRMSQSPSQGGLSVGEREREKKKKKKKKRETKWNETQIGGKILYIHYMPIRGLYGTSIVTVI